jgi:hypothetical protein
MAVPPVPARPPGNQIVPNPPAGGPAFNPAPGALGSTVLGTPPPATPEPGPTQGPSPLQPGSDLYDWHSVNTALQNAGLNYWQIAGSSHSPINQGKWVSNPSYNKLLTPQENKDAGNGEEYTYQQDPNGYVVGVTNPATGQMLKVTLSKQPDASGGYTWAVTGRENQGTLDKAQPGYTSVTRLPFADGHEELFGTNTATGAYEKMPNQPANLGNLKGWNDIRQIEQNGQLVWVGTNPQGQPLQPIPNAPSVNTAKYVPGSVKQINRNGKLVYVGTNAQTQAIEDIPEYGTETAPIKTTTVGGTTYKENPNAGQPGQPDFVRATGLASANEGDTQWADATGGYLKHQTYQNGAWHDDPDIPQRPFSPASQRAEGALKAKGEKYFTPLTGSPDTLVEVTADGNGGYTYEMGPNGEPPRTQRIPGIQQPQAVTGAGSDEFLPQRRDPYTQQLLPPERNPNWSPVNAGDRVRQIQDQARARMLEIHAQVTAGTLTEDQADERFNDWWKTNVDPSIKEIQFAQQSKQQEQARSNLATAQTAANAITTATAGEHRVGPGFGAALANIQNSFATGKFPTPMSAQDMTNALVTPAPDYNKLYEQATAQALAHISPTAAQIATGQPTPTGGLPQNLDVTAQLTPDRYLFRGGAQPMPNPAGAPSPVPQPMPNPAAAPPPVPTPMPMPTGPAGASYDWNALLERMNRDRQLQAQQAQAMAQYQPAPYQPAF